MNFKGYTPLEANDRSGAISAPRAGVRFRKNISMGEETHYNAIANPMIATTYGTVTALIYPILALQLSSLFSVTDVWHRFA